MNLVMAGYCAWIHDSNGICVWSLNAAFNVYVAHYKPRRNNGRGNDDDEPDDPTPMGDWVDKWLREALKERVS